MSGSIGDFVIGESEIEDPGQTTVQTVIPSYLYQQYSDDDDLQAFTDAFNQYAQVYLDWFNQINLPVYTKATVAGALLDWVAEGLYGISRPALPSGKNQYLGPFNTFAYNVLPFNGHKFIGPVNYTATNDDTFKRIITWHFYKGDGKYFNVLWLKRRIVRFLNGLNGTAPNVDQTYQVSVSFGVGNQINIRLLVGIRTVTGGAFYNRYLFNTAPFNSLASNLTPLTPITEAPILQAAINAGVLELPFQFVYVVTISG